MTTHAIVPRVAKAFTRGGFAHAFSRTRIALSTRTHVLARLAAVTIIARARQRDVIARASAVTKRPHGLDVHVRGQKHIVDGSRARRALRVGADAVRRARPILRRRGVARRRRASTGGVTPTASGSIGARAARRRRAARIEALADAIKAARARVLRPFTL